MEFKTKFEKDEFVYVKDGKNEPCGGEIEGIIIRYGWYVKDAGGSGKLCENPIVSYLIHGVEIDERDTYSTPEELKKGMIADIERKIERRFDTERKKD